jgi:hypothetical protein
VRHHSISLFLAGFTSFTQRDCYCLLPAFDLCALAGAWLAGLQCPALELAHHLGYLVLLLGHGAIQ